MSLVEFGRARLALAINLELSHGRHGAAARVELLERAGRRVARVDLSGWVEDVAMGRFERTVQDLAGRGVEGLILNCSRLRHVDHRCMRRLTAAMAPFALREEGLAVLGLSPGLRERYLSSANAARADCVASSPVAVPAAGEREWAS